MFNPPAYQVPANFDASVLSSADVKSKASASRTLPKQVFQRWTQLRLQVTSMKVNVSCVCAFACLLQV